jgi:hypothetical protein
MLNTRAAWPKNGGVWWRRRLAGAFSVLDTVQKPPAGRRRHNNLQFLLN